MKRLLIILFLLVILTPSKVFAYDYTVNDIIEIASILNSEANTEPDKSKRLVVDTILNRVDNDKFPSDVEGVLSQENQFATIKKAPTYENLVIVCDEVNNRTDNNVLYFRTGKYHEDTKPIAKEGKHYFSGLK